MFQEKHFTNDKQDRDQQTMSVQNPVPKFILLHDTLFRKKFNEACLFKGKRYNKRVRMTSVFLSGRNIRT